LDEPGGQSRFLFIANIVIQVLGLSAFSGE
jgi:hypothetical protein